METQRNPTISVVTVVRNNLPGLKITAGSVAAQTYSEVEHIIVDGNSTDGTLQWLDDNPLGHSMPWVSESDTGIYDAMNKGLARANGDLIIFLNGGDSFANQDVLKGVASSWSDNGWPWAYGALRYIDAERKPIREYRLGTFSREKVARGRAFVPHPTTFIRTDLVRRYGGFRLDFGFSADQELIVRVSKEYPPYVFDEVLSDYLIEGAHGSSSYKQTSKRYQKIRLSNDLLVGGRRGVDEIFTSLQASIWSARAGLSSLMRRIRNRGR